MSDERHLDDVLLAADPEADAGILRALETRDPQSSDPQEIERQYLEVAGLLALQAGFEEPRASLKAELLSQLQPSAPSSPAQQMREPAPVVSMPVREQPFEWWRKYSTLVAAAAAVLALALALVSTRFAGELQAQRERISSLETELELYQPSSAEAFGSEAMALQVGLEMKPEPGTRLCKLDSRDPNQPNAQASVFLQPNQGRWLLDARNLRRCPLGRVYQVWFLTADGPVRGGAFQIHDNAPIVLGSDDLPAGTQAVMVTLENAAEIGAEPAGPMVLFGDESRELL